MGISDIGYCRSGPSVDPVAPSRKPDQVHDKGGEYARCATDDHAEEDRPEPTIELNAADAHDDRLEDPDDEYRRDLVEEARCGDDEADGMDGPPGKSVAQTGKQDHDSCAETEQD